MLKSLGFVTDLLFPKRCPGCDSILRVAENSRGFCRKCTQKISWAVTPTCMKCGKPLNNDTTEYCQNCKEQVHFYTQSKGVFRYSGPMKNAMYRFKYSNKRCYSKIFVTHTIRAYKGWLDEIKPEVIIPVPMFEKKKRLRGYNQAEVFAKELSKATFIPYETEIIRRTRNTEALKQLNCEKRKKNLQNAFKVDGNIVKFKKVLVVDDIYTTGSTMDEIARILKEGNVEEIYCLSVCVAGSD